MSLVCRIIGHSPAPGLWHDSETDAPPLPLDICERCGAATVDKSRYAEMYGGQS